MSAVAAALLAAGAYLSLRRPKPQEAGTIDLPSGEQRLLQRQQAASGFDNPAAETVHVATVTSPAADQAQLQAVGA